MVTRQKALLGVVMVLASAVCYATLPALVKLAYQHGADSVGVLAMRFGISAPILLAYVLLRRPRAGVRAAIPALVFPALIYFFQTLTFFESLAHMSAVIAVLILFSYPLMVSAGGALFLGERLTPLTIVLIGAGAAGVALSVGFGGHASVAGVALGFTSALLFAVFFLIAKQRLSTTTLDGVTLTAITYILGGLGFPALMLVTGANGPSDTLGWLLVSAIAVIGTVAGAVLLFSGLRYLSAGTASMLSAAEPPVAIALAALLLAEPVAASQIAGMAIVAVALGTLGYLAARGAPAELPPGP